MKNRKALDISTIIQFYNIFQVVACTFFVLKFHDLGFSLRQTWKCDKNLTAGREEETFYVFWWFLMLRTLELVETVFFILRKKEKQASALHIYHHISSIVLMWVFLKYSAGEYFHLICHCKPKHLFFSGMMEIYGITLNCCVHVVMYLFYFCSSIKSLSGVVKVVKPLLTAIQIVQLSVMLVHCFVAVSSSCKATKLFYLQIFNISFLIFLFAKFFVQSYMKKNKVHSN